MTALDFDTGIKPALRVLASPAFARVDVYPDAAQVADAWAELEAQAPCSIYQTRRFVLPWLETVGRAAGVEPRFVLARDWDRRPVALLCLGIRRRGLFRVATWLGGKDANFNMPLLRRPALWDAAELARLLKQVACALEPDHPDLFDFPNQPLAWAGAANPFALLRHQASPSAAFASALPADAELYFKTQLSKDTRKKLRKKEAKLAELGLLTHVTAPSEDERQALISVFLRQKTARLQDRNVASCFDKPETRAFIEAASASKDGAMELHALKVGDRVVAIYGGGLHGGQWSGMFNSFDPDEAVAKFSPGDLLLMRIVADCCARGVRRFDLGIGEARYKSALCKEAVSLIDVRVATSLRGRCLALVLACGCSIKRRLKKNQRAMRLVRRLSPLVARG